MTQGLPASNSIPAASGVSNPPASARPAADGGPHSYRPFLDGLRAVAVLGVLVYHLNRAWLPGGFLGVDIFFVLSGYLITTLLLTEHRETGRIHLPGFWARRLRRLLPALLVMLVAIVVLVNLSGDQLALGQARGDLLATLFYVANWHFITSGQSYFAGFVSVSPDRHTWSLAIEEQFYLVWPIVASVVLARFRKSALALIALAVATLSALWMAVIFDPIDPSRSYYGTDSRIFEILIGVLLAIALAGRWRDLVGRVGRLLAPVTLLSIAAAYVWLADDNPAYYHGGAVALSLVTAALIAGLECGSPVGRLMSLRPLVLVGLCSYGMYLWHFPVIVFTNLWLGSTTAPGFAALAVAVTFAVTAVSYVVVERPIRRRGLLLGYKLTPARLVRVVPLASGLVAVVIIAATANGVTNPYWGIAVNNPPLIVVSGPTSTPSASTAPSAASATSSAVLDPAASATATPTPIATPTWALAGKAGWTVGIVGDSVAESAAPGLEAEAARRGWRFIDAARPACPVGYGLLYGNNGVVSPSQCGDAVRSLHDQLIAAKPDVIIWHDLQSVLARRDGRGVLLMPGTAAWKDSLFAEWTMVLQRFTDAGSRVVILLPPFRSQQTPGCQGVAQEDRCRDVQNQDYIIREATTEWLASLGGHPGVYLVEVDSLLCPRGIPCPVLIGGMQVRYAGWDQTHLTAEGSAWFAPRLLDRVVATLRAYDPPSPPPSGP